MNTKYNRKVRTEVMLVPQMMHQVLPDNVVKLLKELGEDGGKGNIVRNAYITALRYAGWTLQSVADAAGISRERVRQIETKTPKSYVAEISQFQNEFPIPAIPTVAVEKDIYEAIMPSDTTLTRLLELQPLAQQVRASSPRFRKEAEEYTALLWHAHSVEGVSLYRLGKILGVTHAALRFRLVRYGYMSTENGDKDSKVYRPVRRENRAIS